MVVHLFLNNNKALDFLPINSIKNGGITGQDDVLMSGDAPAGIHVDDLAKAIADDAEQKAHLFQRFTVAEV